MSEITLKNIAKSYNHFNLYDDFNIGFKKNEISCILGPSGCGKTTLLNILCGNIKLDTGLISGIEKQSVSYIFQEPRLLPWKTVKENILFVLKGIYKKGVRDEIAGNYVKLVHLEEFADYYPHQLSGGMKQRVSIARAFSYPSELILMDEPFKALDIKLKKTIIEAFKDLWINDRRTVIFVTHDVNEALLLGQDIFIFSKPPVKIKKVFKNDQSDKREMKKKIYDLLEE